MGAWEARVMHDACAGRCFERLDVCDGAWRSAGGLQSAQNLTEHRDDSWHDSPQGNTQEHIDSPCSDMVQLLKVNVRD